MSFSYSLDTYAVGSCLCIKAIKDGELYGKLSVNIPGSEPLEPNEFWAKTYSENAHWVPKLLFMSEDFEPVSNKKHETPYATVHCYRVTPTFIKRLFELTYNSKTDIYEASDVLFKLHERYCNDNNPLQAN